MKTYIMLWEDRHSDASAYVFSDAEKAVVCAKRCAQWANRFGDLVEAEGDELSGLMKKDGWIYNASYGDSNHIRVVVVEMDKEPEL